MMKVIYNNTIPFKGFKAINLFGVCEFDILIERSTLDYGNVGVLQCKSIYPIMRKCKGTDKFSEKQEKKGTT